MRIITAQEIEAVMNFRDLLETLRRAFRVGVVTGRSHTQNIARPHGFDQGELTVSSAWHDFASQNTIERGFIGTRIESSLPSSEEHHPPSVAGVYLLQSGKTGTPLALLDGKALVNWRAAATSALASSYLSREDSSRLLMVGAGNLAPYLIEAHAAVRPIKEVLVWNRSPAAAQKMAEQMQGQPFTVSTTSDLGGAVRGADIVCCATSTKKPLINGEWLQEGTHLDLVGSTHPDHRECDNGVMTQARLFLDDYERTPTAAGDLRVPLTDGVLSLRDIASDLVELCQGDRAGRRFYEQITLFKSTGTALADLAVAGHIFLRV
ncbi:Alanine dehydrogenase [Pseudovibrio axinellae]|uniref:Alanine dehydrogenase n=1 Tax=Pseudovibrio axinellae TaxID=989403 RepID=A0A165Z025_9HYPH|nr:ornithine cyclodeaminase family protein [Pseudovibrio axinellae]KZL19388.1 Alanine dehydrogenase [Pseudovibrio axinellae]SEQ38478.1 ornithine cyclodeaminase [Pseudovibrio axinellae]